MEMELNPAKRVEVERLKPVFPFPANKLRPTVMTGVEQRRTADRVRLVGHQLDDGPVGRFDGEAGPANALLRQIESQGGAFSPVQLKGPTASAQRTGKLTGARAVGLRRAHLEILVHRT